MRVIPVYAGALVSQLVSNNMPIRRYRPNHQRRRQIRALQHAYLAALNNLLDLVAAMSVLEEWDADTANALIRARREVREARAMLVEALGL